jgi:predicted small secreted protein
MKSTITLLAITVLAAFALVGCNQNTPSNSTDAQSTNSSMSDAGGAVVGTTNMPATNSLPDVNTNSPATVVLPDTNTNMPANTNQ